MARRKATHYKPGGKVNARKGNPRREVMEQVAFDKWLKKTAKKRGTAHLWK